MKKFAPQIQIQYKSNIYWDFGMMLLGVMLAFAVCTFVFKWMGETGLVSGGMIGGYTNGGRPAAAESAFTNGGAREAAPGASATTVGGATIEGGEYALTPLPIKGFAYRGQKNVTLMKMEMYAAKSLKIKKLVFDFDGFAQPSDLDNMQIYLDGKFVAEVPFYEARGKFENLNLNLQSGTKYVFEVKGKIGNEAAGGNRIRIGLKDAGSIDISVEGGESDSDSSGAGGGSVNDGGADGRGTGTKGMGAQWPMWSGYVSVIGGKL